MKPLIVAIGGTLRPGSSTERALEICLAGAEQAGGRVALLGGADIVLPLYNPESTARTSDTKSLLELVRLADGLIIGSPGYHGSISGLVKNALDYVEDLRSDVRPYFDGRAVGCIACAAGSQATGSTLVALRSIVHALRGWPTPLGVGINTATKVFDSEGRCLDDNIQQQLYSVGEQVVSFCKGRQEMAP